MEKTFNLKGTWFLPEKPERKFSGTLIFDHIHKPYLEVIGFIYESIEHFTHPIIILGITIAGKEITLFQCHCTKMYLGNNDLHNYEFSARFALLNKHFYTTDSLLFKGFAAEYHLLHDWYDPKGITSHGDGVNEISFSYKFQKPTNFKIDEETEGSIQSSIQYNVGKTEYDKIEMTQKSLIKINILKEKHLDENLKLIGTFRNFLTLCAYTDCYPLQVWLLTEDAKESIELLAIPTGLAAQKRKPLHSSGTILLFTFQEISKEFESIISNFFSSQEKLRAVYWLLFTVIQNDYSFNENLFLNMAQALETFHRKLKNNEVLPKEEHKKNINAIIDDVDEKYKDWLKAKLAWSNEPSLKERLKDLIDEYYYSELENIIGDPKIFINSIVNNRNYYTHYNDGLKSKILEGTKLIPLTNKIKAFLIVCILTEIGLSKDLINKIITRLYQFHFYY